MSFASETAKVRDRVLPFLNGPRGLDLGVHAEKITPTAVGVDRNPAAPAVNVILDVTLPLPWSDGYFDWVFSSHCLEHLPQPPAAILPEWWRVVRRGGVLALYLPHKNLYKEYNPEHYHEFSTEQIVAVVGQLPGAVVVHQETEDGRNPQFYSFLVVARKA